MAYFWMFSTTFNIFIEEVYASDKCNFEVKTTNSSSVCYFGCCKVDDTGCTSCCTIIPPIIAIVVGLISCGVIVVMTACCCRYMRSRARVVQRRQVTVRAGQFGQSRGPMHTVDNPAYTIIATAGNDMDDIYEQKSYPSYQEGISMFPLNRTPEELPLKQPNTGDGISPSGFSTLPYHTQNIGYSDRTLGSGQRYVMPQSSVHFHS